MLLGMLPTADAHWLMHMAAVCLFVLFILDRDGPIVQGMPRWLPA